jgi:hypothetical protein
MRINAADRKALNHCPSLIDLNHGKPMTYSRYVELYNTLQDEVNRLGVSILGVTTVDRSIEQTERRRHELHVNGMEDEIVDNCVFCVSIYEFENGKVEFVGYFS